MAVIKEKGKEVRGFDGLPTLADAVKSYRAAL